MQLTERKKQELQYLYQTNHRLQNKESHKRQRRTLHDDKRVNPTRRYNHYKYYAPNTEAPTYVKQIPTELKGEIECNAFILGNFNTHSEGQINQTEDK